MRRHLWTDESGQILPLLGVAVILLLAAGMLVLWLGASTSLATKAQTAADAAALAGERELVNELKTPHYVNGRLVPVLPDPGAIAGAAELYAGRNDGRLVGSQVIPTPGYGWGYDVSVTVQGTQTMPSGSIAPGAAASAQARASTNPFSSPSPVTTDGNTPSCDAATISGPRFTQPPTGPDGFFPLPTANFSVGCEALLAGRLNALGIQLSLKLSGLEGYVSADKLVAGDSGAAAAHICAAAAKVDGLQGVSDAQLKAGGLVRVPGEEEEIELAEQPGCVQGSASQTADGNVGLGNPSVHLVDVNGGPQGSITGLLSGAPTSLNESQLQISCQIYQVAQAHNLPEKAFYIALLVGFDESDMGQNTGGNTTDPGASVGVFQQISNDGWGTIADELNVVSSAEMFFEGAHTATGSTEGLMYHYAQDPGAPPWSLAQQTQGSLTGETSGGLANYGAPANVAEADAMLAKIRGGACSGAA